VGNALDNQNNGGGGDAHGFRMAREECHEGRHGHGDHGHCHDHGGFGDFFGGFGEAFRDFARADREFDAAAQDRLEARDAFRHGDRRGGFAELAQARAHEAEGRYYQAEGYRDLAEGFWA
jgi:hypothetical protein